MSKVAVLKLLNDGLCYQLITQSSDLRWGESGVMMLWVKTMKTFMVAGFVAQGKDKLAPGAVLSLLLGLLAGLVLHGYTLIRSPLCT